MTAQERIAMMNRTISAENIKKESDRLCKEAQQKKLMAEIISMGDRIANLITVANHCAESGAMPSRITYSGLEDTEKCFCTNGITHQVGFYAEETNWQSNKYRIRYIGFDCGGCCGKYDFYTNGTEVFDQHEDANSTYWDLQHYGEAKRRLPTIEHMRDFLKDFDAFEEMFYKWFDKRFGKEV